jgi:hypothetical protein
MGSVSRLTLASPRVSSSNNGAGIRPLGLLAQEAVPVAAQQLPHLSAGKEPERGRPMWNAILTAGGWVVFGVLIFFWVRWTEREREQFANGNSRYLE